ncbi:MAG TPA: hypothetical protein VFT98_16160 [Myxococcota bacterium]|nr:hypothetical protein [Myxococcota bacterium]
MKYRKKPVVVEAVVEAMQFDKDENATMDRIVIWMNQGRESVLAWHNGTDIFIETREGQHRALYGDWIIRGVQGEFYPCKPEIFAATYEPVE